MGPLTPETGRRPDQVLAELGRCRERSSMFRITGIRIGP